MSDEQKGSSENTDIRCESTLSSHSNQTDSSESTRSTLMKEILTSEKSKEIVNEIDKKISQLVDHINSKKYSERRKKYYTKKIVNKIIENKYSDSTINTLNFAQNTLPSSTPYSTEKDSVKTSKATINSTNNENEKSEVRLVNKNSSDVIIETPKIYSPNHLNLATKETKTLITEIEKNVSEVKVNLGSKIINPSDNQNKNEVKDLKYRTDDTGNVLEIITVQKGVIEKQKNENTSDEKMNKGETVLTLIVKNGEKNVVIKPIIENYKKKLKDNLDTSDSNYEISSTDKLDSSDGKNSKGNIESKTSKNKSDSNDTKSEDGTLTHQYKKTFKETGDKNPQFNNIKDLTPRTLCKIYKLQFNESSTSSSSNTKSSSAVNEEEIDNPITRSKDWKYYKTTSEELFEKKTNSRNKEISTSEEDCAVEYAKKERQRQITWITSEIRWLTKLKILLEKSNAFGSNIDIESLASTQYKLPSKRLVDYDSTMSTGSRTLKDINVCLEELQKVLKEKKQSMHISTTETNPVNSSSYKNTENKCEGINSSSNSSQIKTDSSAEKIQTSSSKDTISYEDRTGVSKTVSKPTKFEIKYFKELNSSSSNSYNEIDKENIYGQLNQVKYSNEICKCDSAVQTYFKSSSSSSKKTIASEKKTFDIALQTSLSNGYHSENSKNSMYSTDLNAKSVAYFLTFEEMRNGFNKENNNDMKKVRSNLKKVKVQVPHIPKTIPSKTENDSIDLELQEYLLKNRSDFVKSAEWRRQCINELMYMRDKRNADLNQRILFTTKEMKNMTDKKYFRTEEVQNKLKKKKNEMQKAFNRQLACLFSKKLQEKTLKGQVTISTSKTVIYS